MHLQMLRKRMMSGWLGAGTAGWVMAAGLVLTVTPQAWARTGVKGAMQQTLTGAAAQAGSTRVHGVITDPDGALIPGATVTLTPASGAAVTAKSGADGTYSALVPPGTYTVRVTMPGFATYSLPNARITAGTTIDAKLQIGVQSQVVTVQANSMQLSVSPDANQSAIVLTGKDLDALSDDPDELSDELTALAGPAAGPNGGQIYVDGFTGGQLPPKSSIREIRINQNPFSAEYDQLGYGRIEVFTKPGTDKLHGYFQLNGNASQFNTDNPLAKGYQPPYHTIFSFGNLSGPLNKNASYNIGGTYRQIETDEFTNTSILAATAGSTALCAPGDAACVETPYQVSTYFPQTRADINPRLDLSLGSKNVLTTRYQYVDKTATDDGINNDSLPSTGYNENTLSNILQMSDTETWKSNVISETRFEYEREHETITPLSTTASVGVSGLFTGGGYNQQSLSDHQDHFEFQSYNSIQLKKNFIRFGGRLRATREAENTESGTNGSFTYATTADYLAGTPSQFTYTIVNNHKIGDTDADLGMYAETDWKARQNLTISYGFRYETQNHLSDHHDIAPRVAFSYGLFSGKGAPKTVLRGGFGLFYTRFEQANVLILEQENGTNTTNYTVENPSASCNPSAPVADFVTDCGATAAAQTTYTAASNLRSPYVAEFAIGADQQVGRNGTISINYVHSDGQHQLATQNIGYNFADPAASTAEDQYFSEGAFNQNQFIVHAHVQTTKTISLFGYYSLNSAHGDTSGAGADITTPGDIKADYGRTTFDVKNRIFLAGSITLPKFIQLSPFMIAQSGNPYNITTGMDNNDDSFFNSRPYLVPASTLTSTSGDNVKTIAGCGTFAEPGYEPSDTSIVPINYCTGPALFTFNLRLTKTFGFGESTASNANSSGNGGGGDHGGHGDHGGGHGGGHGGFGPTSTGKRYNLAFGLQVQNLFNNEDLSTPQGVLSSTNFGQSTQIDGSPYTTTSALRRITLQTSFFF